MCQLHQHSWTLREKLQKNEWFCASYHRSQSLQWITVDMCRLTSQRSSMLIFVIFREKLWIDKWHRGNTVWRSHSMKRAELFSQMFFLSFSSRMKGLVLGVVNQQAQHVSNKIKAWVVNHQKVSKSMIFEERYSLFLDDYYNMKI